MPFALPMRMLSPFTHYFRCRRAGARCASCCALLRDARDAPARCAIISARRAQRSGKSCSPPYAIRCALRIAALIFRFPPFSHARFRNAAPHAYRHDALMPFSLIFSRAASLLITIRDYFSFTPFRRFATRYRAQPIRADIAIFALCALRRHISLPPRASRYARFSSAAAPLLLRASAPRCCRRYAAHYFTISAFFSLLRHFRGADIFAARHAFHFAARAEADFFLHYIADFFFAIFLSFFPAHMQRYAILLSI